MNYIFNKNLIKCLCQLLPKDILLTHTVIMVVLNLIEDQATSLSSASTQEPERRYDVFLSFRGLDSRFTFTGNLYNALHQKGIKTFIDDNELMIGDQLSKSLLQAIEESRISIVVLSENYASSTWCLEELSKILECEKENKQLVWPIFYKVEPSDIRHQRNSCADAMTKHEERFINDPEKVLKWRSSLFQVASLKGWEWRPENDGYEYELIQEIVKLAVTKLHRERINVGENIIGHQRHIEKMKLLLDIKYNDDKVCMLGIHGAGGIGKTTHAKALYNKIVDDFECAAFLGGVRERSNGYNNMLQLQEQLLSQLLKEKDIKICSVDEGVVRMKSRLCCRKVLMVLDDVDKREQLEKLAGGRDWFGRGSRIIVTTRDKHLLKAHNVNKCYEIKLLNKHEALELFCWNAFKMSQPPTTFEDVSNCAVGYAKGLPLALKVIGCNLIGKSVEECECALEQYERIPHREIHDILKVSYDCLEETAKNIFLDIACFFKGEKLDYVEKILAACDFGPKYYVGVLVDKSLLTVEYGWLKMHDLIQDLGKEIVRMEAPSKPGKRSRLFHDEDVLRVLTENSGSSNIEGIMLDPKEEEEEIEWSGRAFEKMKNLRILIIRKVRFSVGPDCLPNSLRVLEWEQYPSESLPHGFNPRKLVVLKLPNSCMTKLEKSLHKCTYLVDINLSNCKFLTHVPDMSGVSSLRELKLDGCENLIEIHNSVGFLKHLAKLNVSKCAKLSSFLSSMWLPSLEDLELYGCKELKCMPNIVGEMKKLFYLNIMETGIEELPLSIGNLTGLKELFIGSGESVIDKKACNMVMQKDSLTRFRSIHLLPTICTTLELLELGRCGLSDEDLLLILKCCPLLYELDVAENPFVRLPTCIKESVHLKRLVVSNCMKLKEIPELPSRTRYIDATNCPQLTTESTSLLWSKVLEEMSHFLIKMPKATIPDWFDHRCEGDTLSIWSRQKVPYFAMAFILKEREGILQSATRDLPIQFYFYTNGHRSSVDGFTRFVDRIGEGLTVLCDAFEVIFLKSLKQNDWNHVKIKFISQHFTAIECGAYVYRKETNMDDIQFNPPNQLKVIGDVL